MDTEILDLIEQALDVTLLELRKLNDQSRLRKSPVAPLKSLLEDECVQAPDQVYELIETISDPLKHSLVQQLHFIGRVLYAEVGTTDNMKEVAEWVASLQVEDYEFRIEALDNAFLGVGAGEDVWRH